MRLQSIPDTDSSAFPVYEQTKPVGLPPPVSKVIPYAVQKSGADESPKKKLRAFLVCFACIALGLCFLAAVIIYLSIDIASTYIKHLFNIDEK